MNAGPPTSAPPPASGPAAGGAGRLGKADKGPDRISVFDGILTALADDQSPPAETPPAQGGGLRLPPGLGTKGNNKPNPLNSQGQDSDTKTSSDKAISPGADVGIPDPSAQALLLAGLINQPVPALHLVPATAGGPPEVLPKPQTEGATAGGDLKAATASLLQTAASEASLVAAENRLPTPSTKDDLKTGPNLATSPLVAGRTPPAPAASPVAAITPATYAPPSVQPPQIPISAQIIATDAATTAELPQAEAGSVLAPPPPKLRPETRSNRQDVVRKDGVADPLFTITPNTGSVKPATAATLATAQTVIANTVHKDLLETDKPAKTDGADPSDKGVQFAALGPSHAAPAVAHAATVAVRGAPETVASLAAQIIKKLEGRSTRFDVELHPADLGRVDVRLEIGASGQISAAMSFENPQAAAELRGRAHELQRALENAGFNLTGGMSFDVAGDRGRQQQNTGESHQSQRNPAFSNALAAADESAAAAINGALSAYHGRLARGLDIRI